MTLNKRKYGISTSASWTLSGTTIYNMQLEHDFSGLCDVLDSNFIFSSLRNILLLPLYLSSRHIQGRSYILLIYILESVASLVRKLWIFLLFFGIKRWLVSLILSYPVNLSAALALASTSAIIYLLVWTKRVCLFVLLY